MALESYFTSDANERFANTDFSRVGDRSAAHVYQREYNDTLSVHSASESELVTHGVTFCSTVKDSTFDSLVEIVSDLSNLGVRECFIGHPEPDVLFIATDDCSEIRNLEPEFRDDLLDLFDDTESLLIRMDGSEKTAVQLNLASNGLFPIVQLVLNKEGL